jgi:SNF2 family DNA or RNA helicase
MLFTPRPYQTIIGDFILNHERCNVWAGMGMGKTSESIAIFNTLRIFGESDHALVIAPKRVAVSTWPNEITKWHESFGHLTIVAAVGTPAQRIEAIKKRAHITCINYENLEWLVEIMGDYWCWDTVIADEATRLKGLRVSLQTSSKGKEFIKGQGSVRAKALAKVAFTKVRRWISLTGSPAPNGIIDLYGQQWFIDQGQRLGSSFNSFQDRWFRSVNTASGYTQLEPLAFAQKQIEDKLKDCTITVDAKDWFDIKAPIERVVGVTLPPKARAIYDQMEKELFAEIETHEVEVFNAGGKSNKCLQIGSGAVYVDSETKEWVTVHDEKIEALKSIVAETNGEPLLVSYQFIPERERILKAFPKAVMLDKGDRVEKAWCEGKIPMLVVHPASAGHGLNLQAGGRILVDFSTGWNLEYDEQVIERIGPTRQLQSGYDRAVFRYRIVAEDTIESDSVLPRIKSKASVQESLKNAMKKRNHA